MKPQQPSKQLLIVEDDIALGSALSEKFTHEGFLVSRAKDGVEGLAKSKKTHPDLILLDILLPKMDGISMMKKLRKDAWGKRVPIVLLTNLSFDDERMRDVVEYQPAFYLVKSEWRLEDIVKKVKECLGLR